MDKKELWNQCIAFHGHACGGLAIGFQAALYVRELFGLEHARDEELVCIAENDACGVDAIQLLLGCSVGKGNLLFHITGKQAWSFYDRKSGKQLRLVLRETDAKLSREEKMNYLLQAQAKDLFDVKPAVLTLPEKAQIFESYICEGCGEKTGANWIRICNGRKLCLDCWQSYDRFHI